jgi:hypothetical protein
MTSEQAKQYEVCKTRRHEEMPRNYDPVYNQAAAMQQAGTAWKTCRWCGTQYQEIPEIRQVERQAP